MKRAVNNRKCPTFMTPIMCVFLEPFPLTEEFLFTT